MSTLTISELALWQRACFDFTLLDVRRGAKRTSEGDEIAGSQWLDPAAWLDWKDEVPKDRPAVVYCAYGHEISQGLAAALRALGVDARHLNGGIDGWRRAGQDVVRLPAGSSLAVAGQRDFASQIRTIASSPAKRGSLQRRTRVPRRRRYSGATAEFLATPDVPRPRWQER